MDPYMDAEVLLSSLLSEDPSIWLDDLPNQDGGESPIKPVVSEETAPSDLFSELEQESLLGGTDPLPEWMSEKVSLTSWLEVADAKPSELLMESSVPSIQENLDLAPTSEIPIPTEELLNALIVDTRFAPQPPSPGEAQAPDLLALSPASTFLTDDESNTSSPQDSSIGSPASPIEQWQVQEPGVSNLGDTSLTTINVSDVLQITPSSPLNGSVILPLELKGPAVEVKVVLEPPLSESPKQKSRARPKVKSVSDPTLRKTKKRDQNKKAATRYRQKKRSEQDLLDEEKDALEETNKELHDKVDSISREIKYLKDLLAEVYKVKGEIKVMRKK